MIKFLLTSILLIPFVVFSQNAPIRVYLHSGNIISTNHIYFYSGDGTSRTYLAIDGRKGQKINIGQVKYVEGTDSKGLNRYFKPLFLHNSFVWAEMRYASARIEMYNTSIDELESAANTNNKHFYYSVDKGPFQDMTFKNMKRDLWSCDESKKFLKKARGIKASQLTLTGIGFAMIASGFIALDKNDKANVEPLFIGSMVIAGGIPMALIPLKNKMFYNAAKAFK